MDRAVLPSCGRQAGRECELKHQDGSRSEGSETHVVGESGVAARHGQQLPHDVHVAVLAGAHERRGAVVVTDVDLRAAREQRSHHVAAAVAHRQHQRRLPRLQTRRQR